MIALVTPGALASEAVLWEWGTAKQFGKRIIALKIAPCTMPEFLPPEVIWRDLTATGYVYAPSQITGELGQWWIDVESKLDEIRSEVNNHPDEGARRLLLHTIQYLERSLTTRPTRALPPEIFQTWFEIIHDLSNLYPHVDEAINRLIDGSYHLAPDWNRLASFQAQHEVYFKPVCVRLGAEVPGVRLPIVIVAVTDQQAKQLDSEAVFDRDSPELKQEFSELRTLLEGVNWVQSYGGSPELWRPFAGTETIHQMVREAVAGVRSRGEFEDRIVPLYANVMSLNHISELRNLMRGSIVVVDYISTRYPPLQERFRKASLVNLPTVIVGLNERVFKRPTDGRHLIRLHFDWEFDKRPEPNDPHREEVWEKSRLMRFLGSQIPRVLEVSDQLQTTAKGMRAHFHRFQQT
jgi:hypothetical protein